MRRIAIAFFFIIYTSILCGQDVVINEILAINNRMVYDSEHEYGDCIELFNKTNKPKDMSGYYLSDSKDSLTKWQFPQGTVIRPNGYLIVWADKKSNSKGLHTNFKITSKGETIRLSNPQGEQIHKLKLGRQYENISYGLNPDGGKEKIYMNPTIGAKNIKDAVLGYDVKKLKENIRLSVNTSKTGFVVFNETWERTVVIVRNKEDQILHRQVITDKSDMIMLDELPAGKYEMQVGKNYYRIIKQ